MMLTETEYLNILDHHQLIVIFMEHGTVDQIPYVLLVSFCEKHECLRVALRCFAEAFAVRVFADAFEDCFDGPGEFLETSGCL
jgi:hypothetical protein